MTTRMNGKHALSWVWLISMRTTEATMNKVISVVHQDASSGCMCKYPWEVLPNALILGGVTCVIGVGPMRGVPPLRG